MKKHFSEAAHTEVNLEALMALKRSEHPNAAFWQKFDRELKEKTLLSLCAPKPRLNFWRLTPAKGAICLLSLFFLQLCSFIPHGMFSGLSHTPTLAVLLAESSSWYSDPMASALEGGVFVASNEDDNPQTPAFLGGPFFDPALRVEPWLQSSRSEVVFF